MISHSQSHRFYTFVEVKKRTQYTGVTQQILSSQLHQLFIFGQIT